MQSERFHQGPQDSLLQRKYFADLENSIVDRMLSVGESTDGHHSSVRKPCVSDSRLMGELHELGFPASSINALRLIPLVMVAWADNHVDAAERRVVLTAAVRLGIKPNSEDHVLLDHWLHAKPPQKSVEAWTRLMRCMMENIGKPAQEKLIDYFSEQMMDVAKAAGGHFGIGRVSAKERHVMDELIGSLRDSRTPSKG